MRDAPTISPTDPTEALMRVARMMMRARRPRGAALLFDELARDGDRSGEVWCSLGAALLGAREPGNRRAFERWAAYVLRDAEVYANRTQWAPVVAELRTGLPRIDDAPFTAIELDDVARLLLKDHPELLADAVDGLPPPDRVLAVIAIVEHSRWALPVVAVAMSGRWGLPGARAVVRRCDRFVGSATVRGALESAQGGPMRDALEPYLGYALDRHRR